MREGSSLERVVGHWTGAPLARAVRRLRVLVLAVTVEVAVRAEVVGVGRRCAAALTAPRSGKLRARLHAVDGALRVLRAPTHRLSAKGLRRRDEVTVLRRAGAVTRAAFVDEAVAVVVEAVAARSVRRIRWGTSCLPSHSFAVAGRQTRPTGPGPPASGRQLVASISGAPSLNTPLPLSPGSAASPPSLPKVGGALASGSSTWSAVEFAHAPATIAATTRTAPSPRPLAKLRFMVARHMSLANQKRVSDEDDFFFANTPRQASSTRAPRQRSRDHDVDHDHRDEHARAHALRISAQSGPPSSALHARAA